MVQNTCAARSEPPSGAGRHEDVVAPKKTRRRAGQDAEECALAPFAPAELREPFASAMPVAEIDALSAALRGEGTRHERALAFGRRLVRQLEVADHPTALASEVQLALEAIELAWYHFRPEPWSPGPPLDFAYAQTVIRELNWARDVIARRASAVVGDRDETTLSIHELSELQRALDATDIIRALRVMHPNLPADRWARALGKWQGEVAPKPGRPKKGPPPYQWHAVVYELLMGDEGRDGGEAKNFRDNLEKWRKAPPRSSERRR